MTTNITPLEALNEILELPKPCTNHCVDCQLLDNELCCYPNKVRYIAEQALAPQEQQQKTFTVDEIKEIINNYFIKEDDEAFYQVKDCRDYLLAEFEKEVD